MITLLAKLNGSHGPSGDEGEIADILREMVAPHVDEISTDVMGNLIAHKRGNGPKIMVCAHMDSIGFIVTHIEKDGFLRVGRLGGISAAEVLYTPVRFKNGVVGQIVKEEKAELSKIKMDNLLIDIGAKDECEAKELVQLGDTAVFDLNPRKLSGCKVSSPYIDNRISCAILVETLRQLEQVENDMYFVFSAQEEVGLRGAVTAAYSVAPTYGISLDVTIADDEPESAHTNTAVLGGGAGIKLMDSAIICHSKMIAKLESIAKEHNISTQREIMRGGSTDSGAISKSRYGVISGGISIPCRYIHTPVETVDERDVTACIQLLKGVATTKFEEV